jgi:hypothetical protein
VREKPLVALEYFRHYGKKQIGWGTIGAFPFEESEDWDEFAEFIRMCNLEKFHDEMHHFSLHHFIPDRFTPLEFMPVVQLSIPAHLRKCRIADGSLRGGGAYGVQTGRVRFRCGVLGEVNAGALLMRSLRYILPKRIDKKLNLNRTALLYLLKIRHECLSSRIGTNL